MSNLLNFVLFLALLALARVDLVLLGRELKVLMGLLQRLARSFLEHP